MAGSLLLVGITLLLVGSLVLARNAIDHGRNWLVLVMPFTGGDYVREHWSELWLATFARILGIALIVCGAGILVARDPLLLSDPLRLLREPAPVAVGSTVHQVNRLAMSEESILMYLRNDDEPRLSGLVRGERFAYDRAELINGVFSARQGSRFIPELEVRLLTEIDGDNLHERKALYVKPEDEDAPELHVSWQGARQSLPETRVYRGGYRLELQFAPLLPGQLKGFMQLILPGTERTFLSGNFVAYTNHLEYREDGRVDLTFNHPDTLEYLARQYIENQYPAAALARIEYNDTRLRLSRNGGHTTAMVYLKNGRVEEKRLQFERADIGWALRPGGVQSRVVLEGTGRPRSRSVDSGSGEGELPPVPMTFADLETLAGQTVTLRDSSGETRQVRILELRRGKLRVEAQVGSGQLQYALGPDEIGALTLPTGRAVTLVSAQDGEPAQREAEPSGTATTPAPGPAPAPGDEAIRSQAIQDYAALDGAQVEIIDRSGRSREGTLHVGKNELRLTVRLGAGSMEYFYSPDEVDSVRPLQ